MRVWVRTSAAAWSTAATYVAAVTVLLLVVQVGSLGLGAGLVALTVVTVLVLLLAMKRDLARQDRELAAIRAEGKVTHKLVNSQRDALLKRIDQLIERLEQAGVPVPGSTGEAPEQAQRSVS